MIRDAQKGMLESIPPDLLYKEAPVDPRIFESSRVFVSKTVPSRMRTKVQAELMGEMIRTARALGATKILGLGPAIWPRWLSRLGLEADAVGPTLEMDDVNIQAAMMELSGNMH